MKLSESWGITDEEFEARKKKAQNDFEVARRQQAIRSSCDRYYNELTYTTEHPDGTKEPDIERFRRFQNEIRKELAIQRNIINAEIRKNREKGEVKDSKSITPADVGW